jgi:hypothetical protein
MVSNGRRLDGVAIWRIVTGYAQGDVRAAQAHSRHKSLSTLIRYDDGRQQLQGKAAKKLAESIP